LKSSNKPESRDLDDLILIGKVVGAHGLRGAVKIYSYAESEDLYAQQERLILIGSDGVRNSYDIAGIKAHKQNIRLTLKGVDSRDQAEALRGWGVYIPKSGLPPLEEGTYYWIDLIGLAVFTTTGEYLGRLTDIIPTGANDVYVVTRGGGAEILIPAIASVVMAIDLQAGRIEVTLPEGLE
jgi:16S rRNA processing protein RimM